MPHALHLTGLSLGLPVLFLIAGLCWLSHCILAVEGRYVGGASLAHVADAVFPRRWHGRWIGEGVVDVWSVIVSGGRAIVVIGVSTQLVRASPVRHAPFNMPADGRPRSKRFPPL